MLFSIKMVHFQIHKIFNVSNQKIWLHPGIDRKKIQNKVYNILETTISLYYANATFQRRIKN